MTRIATTLLLLSTTGCVPHLESVAGQLPWDWSSPENDWPLTEPVEGTVGTGFQAGDTVPDFLLEDQFGQEVSLWQFSDRVIVLDISTIWCAPCQELAKHTEDLVQEHLDEDFMYVTVLQENVTGDPPNNDDLNLWVDQFEITAPVLADGSKEGTGGAVINGQFPALLVIDRDLTVHARVTPAEDAALRVAVNEIL